MKKNLFSLFISLAAVLMTLSLADVSNAQKRRESRGRGLTKKQVKVIIDRVEDRVDNFVKHYDKSLDRSNLDGTKREDNLTRRAKDLEGATDELSREFDRRDAWAENKDEVRKCLNIASDIDRTVEIGGWARTRKTSGRELGMN